MRRNCNPAVTAELPVADKKSSSCDALAKRHIMITYLSDNIRTICILMFNKNGHFISGQSGKRKWGVLVHVVFFGLDELCATHAQHDTMYRYLLFLR